MPGCSIDTGPFDLWYEDCLFETNEGFDHTVEGPVRRFEVCRVFAELAEIIQFQENLSGNGEPIIQIRIIPSAINEYFPDGEDLPEMLNSGLVSQEYSGFFHGMMRFNFDPLNGIPWHASFNPSDLPPANEWDLYSVAYHEAFHVLGFHSFLVNTDNGNFSNFTVADLLANDSPSATDLVIQANNPFIGELTQNGNTFTYYPRIT